MSDLRQAAQQALEALERGETKLRWAAITALRQALAEPEQEPVGHADLGINNIYIFSESEPRVVPAGRTPLYTAPTPRKPQTTHWEGCEAVHPECKTELERKSDAIQRLWKERDELRTLNAELVEALRCADAMLSGANMDAKAVERKVAAALAKVEASK